MCCVSIVTVTVTSCMGLGQMACAYRYIRFMTCYLLNTRSLCAMDFSVYLSTAVAYFTQYSGSSRMRKAPCYIYPAEVYFACKPNSTQQVFLSYTRPGCVQPTWCMQQQHCSSMNHPTAHFRYKHGPLHHVLCHRGTSCCTVSLYDMCCA